VWMSRQESRRTDPPRETRRTMSLAGVLQDCSAFFGNSSGRHFWHLNNWHSPYSLGIWNKYGVRSDMLIERKMELAMIPASRSSSCLAKSRVDFNNSRIPADLRLSSPTTYNGASRTEMHTYCCFAIMRFSVTTKMRNRTYQWMDSPSFAP
jgi:hypothetical protein